MNNFPNSLRLAGKMKIDKGFSLVEIMIVMVVISILLSLSSFAWQRYVNNANLRAAARDVVSDFQRCKQKAISENRDYQISFTTGTNSSYTILASATDTHAAVSTTKLSTVYGSGIQITSAAFLGTPTNVITFQSRGTSSNGTVVMTNSRASTATITTNVTGKAYVQFAML